jgi:hypothetical protein
MAICKELAERVNSDPTLVALEAEAVYRSLEAANPRVGVFDDKDYLLGEFALLAASAYRLMGRREKAAIWHDRSEAAFRHTIGPAASLARVALDRTALHYDTYNFDRVLEAIPSLLKSFEELGMMRQALKTRFIEAMTLKDLNRLEECLSRFQAMRAVDCLTEDQTLHGMVLANEAEVLSSIGRQLEAAELIRVAMANRSLVGKPLVAAQLKVAAAEYLKAEGDLAGAAELTRSAIADYVSIEMSTYAAYFRILLAETLLALSRNREAEWEVMAALPTIESEGMVPEGLAAVALLRESVQRRKADPAALRQVRERIKLNS